MFFVTSLAQAFVFFLIKVDKVSETIDSLISLKSKKQKNIFSFLDFYFYDQILSREFFPRCSKVIKVSSALVSRV